MKRTPVNPWLWSLKLGYNQGEVLEGTRRYMVCAGQTAVDTNGIPQHPEDMRDQITQALDNLEAVLGAAGMGLGDVTRRSVYSTSVDATPENFDIPGARLSAAGAAPPLTLRGVTRLALPALMIEIEATAAQ